MKRNRKRQDNMNECGNGGKRDQDKSYGTTTKPKHRQ